MHGVEAAEQPETEVIEPTIADGKEQPLMTPVEPPKSPTSNKPKKSPTPPRSTVQEQPPIFPISDILPPLLNRPNEQKAFHLKLEQLKEERKKCHSSLMGRQHQLMSHLVATPQPVLRPVGPPTFMMALHGYFPNTVAKNAIQFNTHTD